MPLPDWLLNSPLAAFERGRVELAGSWPLFAGVVLAVTVAVFLLARRAPKARAGRRGALFLAALRTAALALVVFALFRPQLVVSTVVPQENVVGVLFDDSASMRIADAGEGPDGGALRRADRMIAAFPEESAAEALGPVLEERFVLRKFRFGADGAERLPAEGGVGAALALDGARTDLAAALGSAAEELGSLPVAGLVLLTDGADTAAGGGAGEAGDRLEEVLLDLRERGIRVYPVPLGRSEVERDLEIGAPDLPSRMLLGSDLEVRIPLSHQGYGGRTVRLEALDEGRLLASRPVRLPREGGQRLVTLPVPAETAGIRRLRFRVAPESDEERTRNNERTALVEVEERALDLLYFEGQPRWEMKFLRRAVRDDRGLRVACLLRTAGGKFYRVDVADAAELAGGFPETREELFRYSGVVLGSVEASFFRADQLNMLRDLVSRRGGGLLTLGGRSAYAEGGYRDTPLAEVLPFRLPPGEPVGSAAGAPGAGDPAVSFRQLRVTPTRAGASHPVVRLESGPEDEGGRYPTLPLLSTVNRVATVKPGAVTLLEGAPEAGGEPEPVLAFQRFGRGRVAGLTVQDLWLWQMHADIPVEDRTHEILWRRLLRFLAAEAPRRVEASAAPTNALPGERVEITARVLDESYLAVNRATVEAAVETGSGAVELVPLRWTGQRHGEYSAAFVPTSPGLHRITVSAGSEAPGTAAEPPPATAFFEVGNVEDEFFGTGTDRALLSRIASETGGRLFEIDAARALAADLSFSETGATVVERRDLWNMPALFFALVVFLTAEWSLRRAWGLR